MYSGWGRLIKNMSYCYSWIISSWFAAICVIQYLSLWSFSCLFIKQRPLYSPIKKCSIKWGILKENANMHLFPCIISHLLYLYNRNRRNYIFLQHKNFFILLKWCVNVYERILRQKLKMSVKLLFVTVYTKNSRKSFQEP